MQNRPRPSKLLRSITQRLALEPRIVFDGALGASWDAQRADSGHESQVPASARPLPASEAAQGASSSPRDASRPAAEASRTDGVVTPAAPGSEIIFIDSRVEGLQVFLDAHQQSEVIVLDAKRDGVEQIAATLAGRKGISTVQILSHGEAGRLELGKGSLDTQGISANHARDMAIIKSALTDDADILIYGCDVAAGAKGQAFMQALATATGADIAASINPTGASSQGGDWLLESTTGKIEATALSLDGFDGVLTTAPTVTDAGAATMRTTREDTALAISGVSVADADNPASMQASFVVTGGKLNLAGSGWTVTAGANGTSAVTITGSVTQINAALNGMSFTPAADQNSTVAGYAPKIDITVRDLSNSDGPTLLSITNLSVSAVNDAPSVGAGTPLSVTEGGSTSYAAVVVSGQGFTQTQLGLADVDNLPVQVIAKVAALPTHGTLKLNGAAVAVGSTFALSDISKLSYTHDGSQVLSASTDTFQLTYDDGAGGLVVNQPVTINLTPVNQAPSVGGTITVIEGETGVRLDTNGVLPTLGGTRGAIITADPDDAAATKYTIVTLPGRGTLYYNGVAITAAGFVVNDITKLTYSHDGSESTSDSFNVSVTDNGGGTGVPATTTGTINLTIYPNNDDPVLATNLTQTLNAGTSSLTITTGMLRVTDTDSSDVNLAYTLISVPPPAQGYFKLNGQTLVAGATFTQADIAAGRLVYVTLSNTVRTDSILFTVKDGGYRIFPDVRDGGIYYTNAQDSLLKVNTFSIIVPNTVTADPGPAPGTITPNTVPTTGGGNSVSLLEGAAATLDNTMLHATDSDNTAAELVYRLLTLPSSGAVRLNGSALSVGQTFTQADVDSGRVTFQHAGGEDFVDSFTYTVSDGKAVSSPTKTFNISVTPQNDAPVASTTGRLIKEGASLVITPSEISLTDADNSASDNETGYAVNQSLSFVITSTVAHGTLKLNGVDVVAGVTVVTSAELAAGKLIYTHDGSETTSDTFKLKPIDSAGVSGGLITATNQSSTGAEVTMLIDIAPVNDAPSFVSKSEMVAGQAGPIQEGATVVLGGASSYATINGVTGSGTPTPASGAHLSYSDTDNSSVQRQYRITAAPLNGQLLRNGAALGVGSVFTQADLDSGAISYKHNGTETNSDSFQYVVSDGDYTVNDSATYAQGTAPVASIYRIEITPRNDTPTLSAPSSLDAFAAGAATTAIPGITLTDPDLADGVQAGETNFIRVEVQVLDSANALVSSGQLNYGAADPTGGSALVSGKGGNSLIVQGTKAQVDAILASLTIGFSADVDAGNYKIRVTVDDRLYDSSGNLTTGANGGPASANADGTTINAANNRVTKDIALRASNFNDVPTLTNGSAYTVNEDAQVTLSGFSISDVDSFGNVTATVRLYSNAGHTTLANAATEGALILGATTGLSSFSGSGTNTITLTGSLADVQAALNGIKFAGVTNYNGTGAGNGSLYLQTTLADFNHADGQKTATVDNTITIRPVNDAPTLTVPGNQTMASGTSIAIPASFAVADAVDIAQGAADYIEVTVSATDGGAAYGQIQATASGVATVVGNNTATITIKGSTADVQATLNAIIYTPANANVDRTVVITTTVDDRLAGVGNGTEGVGVDGNNILTKTFNINISGINDAPVLSAPATLTVTEDSSNTAIGGISVADSDDFGAMEKVTLDLGSSPKGTITMTTLTGLAFTTGDGTADPKMVFTGTKANINAALATLRFTPTANTNTVGAGNEQSLTITIDDQGSTGVGGAKTDTKTVQITITPVNDAPTRTAANTTLAGVPEDSPATGAGAPAGNTVSNLFGSTFSDTTDQISGGSSANTLAGIAITTNAATPAQGSWQYSTDGGVTWTSLPTVGTTNAFIIAAGDKIRFQPNGNWNGTPGGLTTRLIDSSSGAVTTGTTVNVTTSGGITRYANAGNAITLGTTVTPVNDAPVASGTATLPATSEDTVNPPGTAVSSLITGANYSDATDQVSPGTAGSSSSTALGGIAIVGNAADTGTQGAWQYSTNNGATWTAVPTSGLSDSAALILPTTAQLRFVPVANYNGTPGGLSVRLADSAQSFSASSNIAGQLGGTNNWSSAAVPIEITVTPVNDAPVLAAAGSTQSYIENAAPVTLEPSLSLSDVDDTQITQATVTISGGRVTGDRLNFTNQLGITGSYNAATGVLTLTGTATRANYETALRSIGFDSSSDSPGSGSRTISWTVLDANSEAAANGQQNSNTVTTTVTVTPVNDAPAGADKTITAIEDVTYTFTAADFGFTDPLDAPSANNFKSVFITTLPTTGTLLLNGTPVTAGQEILLSQIPQLTWQGAANANGNNLASFTFQVKDDGGTANGGQDTDQSPNTIRFNVTAVTDLSASDDFAQTNEDTSVTASVATNDSTTSGGTLSYAKATDPAHGTLVFNANGSYTYTPAANYHGPDSFTYTVTDAASGDRLTRTVYLTVKPVVDLTANADKVATNEDTPVSGSVATNDSTTSGGALAYTLTSCPTHGVLVFQADGSYTYTPVADYNGPDSFTYTVTDAAAGERMTQTVTLSIALVDDIADDAVKTDENRPVKIAVLANDSFEGKPVISAVSPGAHGSVRMNQDGTVTYTPNLGWSGEDSFTYTVTSPAGVTETATVKVTVIANPIPVGQSNPGNGFAKPLLVPIQTDPALHVLISVNEARNEMSLRSGLGIFQADSVTTAELMGAVNPDLSFASGLAGRSGVLDQSNALHVQHAVRHLPLVMNDTLHVQNSVRASQLESAARNARVNAYHSATPGISTLFDPFALGAPAAAVKQGLSADDGKKTAPKPSSSTDAGQASHDEQVTGALENSQPDQPAQAKPATTRAHAAAGFGSQLQRVAADFRPRLARLSSARVASR